jgi:putative tryptophan/tyrosine transport system substrate-binding protein
VAARGARATARASHNRLSQRSLTRSFRRLCHGEGRNVSIEFRWGRGQYDRLATLASELVGQRVAIIAANGGARSALAANAATTNIPIVFTFGDGDPVAYGLVRSFNEPGGNVTGITMIAGLLEPKRLEILRELVPGLSLVYVLVNPNNAGVVQDLPSVIGAAGPLGIKLEVVKASTEKEIDTAFSIVTRERAQALMVMNDAFLQLRRNQITALCVRHALPAIYPWREYADAGGLISYGTSIREAYRQSGIYVGQILKGTSPAELPVQQPTKFEMVVNLTTAKILGIEVPSSLLVRADEVIE